MKALKQCLTLSSLPVAALLPASLDRLTHHTTPHLTLLPAPLAAAVYLVQGLLGLSRLAVFTFLKDDLALTPASVALITSAGYAPWVRPPPASAVVQASLLLQRVKGVPWLSTALLATTARCTPGSLTSAVFWIPALWPCLAPCR